MHNDPCNFRSYAPGSSIWTGKYAFHNEIVSLAEHTHIANLTGGIAEDKWVWEAFVLVEGRGFGFFKLECLSTQPSVRTSQNLIHLASYLSGAKQAHCIFFLIFSSTYTCSSKACFVESNMLVVTSQPPAHSTVARIKLDPGISRDGYCMGMATVCFRPPVSTSRPLK